MFSKKYVFHIESCEAMDFVRLLGRLGVRFTVSEERYIADDVTRLPLVWYRTFVIYTSKNKMKDLRRCFNSNAALY